MERITISGLTVDEKDAIKAACAGRGEYVKDVGKRLLLAYVDRDAARDLYTTLDELAARHHHMLHSGSFIKCELGVCTGARLARRALGIGDEIEEDSQ